MIISYIKLGGNGTNVKFEISISQQSFSHSVSVQTYKINIYTLLGINSRLKDSGIKDDEESNYLEAPETKPTKSKYYYVIVLTCMGHQLGYALVQPQTQTSLEPTL